MQARGLRTSTPQATTFVELFFDLVFVFAVTQITVLTAHHLDLAGVGRSILLFWLVWWAWTQFTWTLNPADTNHPFVRALTLAATAVAFVMAVSVPRAFEEDALWFALPYIVVRLLGLGLQVLVDLERPDRDIPGILAWVGAAALGLVAVLAGAIADPALRPWLWLTAGVLDVVSAAVGGRRHAWDLHAGHLSERHGLFVIIAIGESLIIAGAGAAAETRTPALIAAVAGAIAVSCLLWWTYFGWYKDAAEHRFARSPANALGQAARDAFSLAHFPLVCGIIGFAVAIEEIVIHPDEPPPAEVVAALGIGIALVLLATAASWRRLGGEWLLARIGIVAVVGVALAGLAVVGAAPWAALAVVAAGLLAVVLVEGRGPHPA